MTDLREMKRTIKGVGFPYPVLVGGGIVKTVDQIAKYASTETTLEWGSITTEPKSGNGGRDYYAHYVDKYGRSTLAYALNSIGLTNPGIKHVQRHAADMIARYRDNGKPLPINISGEGVDDTLTLMKQAIDCGFPVISVNAACPNKVGKDMKPVPVMCYDIDSMAELITRADQEIRRGDTLIMLKVSTGLPVTTLRSICTLLKTSLVFEGLITGNTVPNGFAFLSNGEPAIKTSNGVTVGGLSGPAIKPLSLSQTRFAADILGGQKVVWGCGGVETAQDVREYLQAGATMVQIVTAFREHGENPVFIRNLLEDLID